VVGVNIYLPMQDALRHPLNNSESQWGKPFWAGAPGVWSLFRQLDVSRAIRQQEFLVTETHAMSIGEQHVNYPPFPGQLRQVAWSMIGRGARMVEYWQWHTPDSGHETYWGGILGHSRTPGRVYAEIAAIGRELGGAAAELDGLRPDTDAALVHSVDSKWALEFAPPLPDHRGEGDRSSYERIFDAYYRALFDGGWQLDVVFDDDLPEVQTAVDRWPVLVLPAVYVADDDQVSWYADYAAAGGHLVLGYHPGYADLEARPRIEPALQKAAGVAFAEFSTIAGTIPIRSDVLSLSQSATARGWADAFELDGAQSIATYDHPHLGRWPAITTHPHGAGRVTCVGTLPDEAVGAALAEWLSGDRLVATIWGSLPSSVTITSARSDRGRLWFCHNWAWHGVQLILPVAVVDLLSGAALAAGSALVLAPWDIRVLVERIPTRDARPAKENGP